MIKTFLFFVLIAFSLASLPERILKSFRILQTDCNGNGYLYRGQCFCLSQWTGAQCEIRSKLLSFLSDKKYKYKKDDEGFDDNLSNTCGDMIVRLDNLYNIAPNFYFFDDDVFPRLTYNSIYGNDNLSETNNWTCKSIFFLFLSEFSLY